MKTKFKHWGAILVVFGAASLVLPFVGIQLRIFNLFGTAQRAAGIAAIVLGSVLWVIGKFLEQSFSHSRAGALAFEAPPLPTGGTAATTRPEPNVCPRCGAPSGSDDRFCIECGTPLQQPPLRPQATAAPAMVASGPKHPRKVGRNIFLVLLLLIAAAVGWFFFGPSKAYKLPAARSAPAVPARLAGTLNEFPVDSATTNRLQPANVVSQTFPPTVPSPAPRSSTPIAPYTPPPPVLGATSPAIPGTVATPTTATPVTVQAATDTFPPGLNTSVIPQVATAATSATYRGADAQSAPVYVHVIDVGANLLAALQQFVQGIAQGSGGTTENARVESPQGQTYDGYSVRSGNSLVYILSNPNAGNIIILYTPRPEGFSSAQRLAGNVGNGRGLNDYPQVADTYAALPASTPPGYQLSEMRGFTGGELNAAMSKSEGQARGDVAALKRITDTARVFIPERGTAAVYKNGQGQEKGVLVGNYGSSRKANIAWRALSWTFGWAMEKNKRLGFDALISSDQQARIMLFQKGPYIGMTKVPGTASEQELLDLAASVQF